MKKLLLSLLLVLLLSSLFPVPHAQAKKKCTPAPSYITQYRPMQFARKGWCELAAASTPDPFQSLQGPASEIAAPATPQPTPDVLLMPLLVQHGGKNQVGQIRIRVR